MLLSKADSKEQLPDVEEDALGRGEAFHTLGTEQLISCSRPTVPNEKAYAGQQDRGTEAGTMGPRETNS